MGLSLNPRADRAKHEALQFTIGANKAKHLSIALVVVMLLQDGYPPALVLRDWRQRYIKALQEASQGNYQGIINLMGQAVELSLDRYLHACTDATSHLLPMKELATIFETSVDYLGQLARTGNFDAQKRGSYWFASVEAVAQYFHEAKEQPRGRPRKTST